MMLFVCDHEIQQQDRIGAIMISGTGTSHANSTPGQKKKSRIDLKILENLGAMDNTLVVRLLGHSSRIFPLRA